MRTAFSLSAILLAAVFSFVPRAGAASPYEGRAASAPVNPIDRIVFGRLAELKIEPADLCSDSAFVRRAFLDVIGTLPSATEARQFIRNPDPNKRRALIDRLLQRDEFAEYWAMKWSDLLKVKAEFPVNLWPKAAQAYHHWLLEEIRNNVPYDRFARDLLTSSGSNFRVAPVNFFRAVQAKDPSTLTRAVALTFMGERAEKWPSEKLAGMAVFFSQVGYKYTQEWKEEIVYWDAEKADQGPGQFPDGTVAQLPSDRDPREVFADWLIRPDNPWFTRNIANRVWFWLMGRGIIQEPDDIRPDNPPSNPELLKLLQDKLIEAHYDLNSLFRLILNSQAYQLSCVPKTDSPQAPASFASYAVRRLDAEVLIDALDSITGTTESYSSAIPEPYTFVPVDQRSIALPDGSITSSFLETFGRSSRDTGLELERNNHSSANQELHLLNSTHIRQKIQQGPKIQAILRSGAGGGAILDELYLTILSRHPTEQERSTLLSYYRTAGISPRESTLDIVWALLNSAEFLYRH
jgi:hypothetical protein